jgi:hypothetical protein
MQSEPAFDLAATLEQIDGDRELFVALADLFMSQASADMGSIRDALKLGDSQEIMKRPYSSMRLVSMRHRSDLRPWPAAE